LHIPCFLVDKGFEHDGLSAFWFTFGGGVGCVIMGIWLARPLRRSGLSTIPQYLDRRYGRPVSMLSLLSTAGSLILEWSFLSMGLRGAATFFPFLFAIVAPGRLSRAWGLASSAGGLLTLVAVSLVHMPFDPMLAAIGVSGALAVAGYAKGPR
jgi:hypothetical protein